MQAIDLATAEEHANKWCLRMAQILVSNSTNDRYPVLAYGRPQIVFFQLENLCQYVGDYLSKTQQPQKYILNQYSSGFHHSMDLEEFHEKLAKKIFGGVVWALTYDSNIDWDQCLKMMNDIASDFQKISFTIFNSEEAPVVVYDFIELFDKINIVVQDVLTPLTMNVPPLHAASARKDHQETLERMRPFKNSGCV